MFYRVLKDGFLVVVFYIKCDGYSLIIIVVLVSNELIE